MRWRLRPGLDARLLAVIGGGEETKTCLARDDVVLRSEQSALLSELVDEFVGTVAVEVSEKNPLLVAEAAKAPAAAGTTPSADHGDGNGAAAGIAG